MRMLYWSDELAASAQRHANRCDFRHSRDRINVGENIWAAPFANYTEAVGRWLYGREQILLDAVMLDVMIFGASKAEDTTTYLYLRSRGRLRANSAVVNARQMHLHAIKGFVICHCLRKQTEVTQQGATMMKVATSSCNRFPLTLFEESSKFECGLSGAEFHEQYLEHLCT
uniref:SCP domain-containing protein n=1 Tax=Parascaris univalens TaxID=6257 RepID=A0A915B606_PARUN